MSEKNDTIRFASLYVMVICTQMLKKWILFAICLVLLVSAALIYAALKQAKTLRRDPIVLMNKYYRFKTANPDVAKKSLLIILKQDDGYVPALQEYSQWLLSEQEPQQAIRWLERLHELMPENGMYTFQLGYLYYMSGEWQKAKLLFTQLLTQVSGPLKTQAQQAIKAMASYLPYYQYHATVNMLKHLSTFDKKTLSGKKPAINLINTYYLLKKKDQRSAEHLIKQIITQQPHNIQALKEAGYLAIATKNDREAIDYFTRVYHLTYQPDIAMQLAYLYDQINNKPKAYQYFKLATQSPDKRASLLAENALTNLAGQQTKALPVPYFSDFFFSPFSQSRFGLTVVPFLSRLGIEQNNRLQTKEYVFFRRVRDNRSANLGQLPQLYEDNVQITGMGGQMTPFRNLPIVGFIEAGAAYDLVYQNRNRWRGDLRVGLMYYQLFGTRPAYFPALKISHQYYNDWYGDLTYFSRYHNNVIGLIRTHQGIHLLQYRSSVLNLYMMGRMIGDTQRVFYNNVAEIGPGVSLIPSNRLNFELRFEYIKGTYLPAKGFNPYGKHYTNALAQLLFYVKL